MKPTIVNIHEAKTHLSRLLEQVGKGGEIIIAKAGVPKARLVPIPESQPRQPGKFRDAIEWNSESFAPLTAEELRDWE